MDFMGWLAINSFWLKIINVAKWQHLEWVGSKHFLQCLPHGSFPISPPLSGRHHKHILKHISASWLLEKIQTSYVVAVFNPSSEHF